MKLLLCCHGLFAGAATHKKRVVMVTMTVMVMMILVEGDLYVQWLKEDLELVVNVCFWSRPRTVGPALHVRSII